MNQTKSVAIYARVSTDKQKVEMQLAELREYVQQAEWKVNREFVDEGYSGKILSGRLKFSRHESPA
jgi:site-specific DNA recombinase